MECSLCSRELFEPFTAQVFHSDGSEETTSNQYHSEKSAVVVYSHKDCFESPQTLSKRRKRGPQMNPHDPLAVRAAEKFVKKNYRIVRKGQRFLIVIPRANGI